MKQLRSASNSDPLHSGGGGGRLDAMEQRISKLELMAEDVRSALGSIMGQLGLMDAKFDAQLSLVNAKLDAQVSRLDEKLDAQVRRLDEKLDAQVMRLDEKLDAKFGLMDIKLDTEVAHLDAKFGVMDGRFSAMDAKFDLLNAKLDAKPDQGWMINVIGVIFGLVLAAVGASAGLFALIR